ncbi:PhoX family phosphatase [Accumulibacter sp.]|uniref:PhoX family protein n=1 Tax=Accumulibacter sp. TaxID=2053492 RepID=UPI0025E3CD41|nr:PhoX family phosphatase [Accumulibacter sp.]MCM8596685.1 PhoX family phosphatase [Accumulibacter sp.]MCM8627647.1 PhoX family phosphatase [Accumulibacter sp.]MDS4050833.1 PhoX family phosphatase [Accumulibacter sp.]
MDEEPRGTDASPVNESGNRHLNDLLVPIPRGGLTRRRLLQMGLAGGVLPFLGLPARAAGKERLPAGFAATFEAVAASTDDLVHVPEGYSLELLYAWGDPVSDGPVFRADASNSAAEQAEQAGMHHDGMHFFPFVERGRASSSHGLLCVNHEYTDEGLLHPDGRAGWTAEKTLKSQCAHGVSIVEIDLTGEGREARWRVVRPSPYARRITARTPLHIDGPAAGDELLRTHEDPRGERVLGTLANCAMGVTPWGTYLSCEENFNVYFLGSERPTAGQRRYGIRERAVYRWHEHDPRFAVAGEPNEPNRFGWVIEIDPWNPGKMPVKHTALGRFKHEGATVRLARDGRVVVYMGDDEAFEYIYKYVSRERFDARQRRSAARRPADGRLLEDGTLYVARFAAGGHGRWVALRHGENGLDAANGFASQAEVLIHARLAADHVGATKMDRPEWIAVHPQSGEVYCSLTHNRQRVDTDAANPRPGNVFGHIVRWREDGGDAAAMAFSWDVFVLCGDPGHADPKQRGNIRGDAFGSPDGLWFDRDGRLWIQTDAPSSSGDGGDYARIGNNQVLVADVTSRRIRRFLTGPRGCEMTGLTGTPDGRNVFVNVQHPGELPGSRSDPARPLGGSAWPANQFPEVTGGRPRSATVVIRRVDGGVVGG